jgi:excisionase family DNA binding protein
MPAHTSPLKANLTAVAATPALPPINGSGAHVLTVIEVAAELRCSKAHVLNLINGRVSGARPLPSLWLGRRRLIRRCSLDEWIKANEHGAML